MYLYLNVNLIGYKFCNSVNVIVIEIVEIGEVSHSENFTE